MNSEAFFMVGEDSSDLFAINSSLATESAGFHYKGFLCVWAVGWNEVCNSWTFPQRDPY